MEAAPRFPIHGYDASTRADLGTVVAVLAGQPYRVRRELGILLAIQTQRARQTSQQTGAGSAS